MYMNALIAAAIVSYAAAVPVNIARDAGADAEAKIFRKPGLHPWGPHHHVPEPHTVPLSQRDASPEAQLGSIGTLFSDIFRASRPATSIVKPGAEHGPSPSSTGSPKPTGTGPVVAGGMEIATRDEFEELAERGDEDELELEERDAQLGELGELFAGLGKLARPASKPARVASKTAKQGNNGNGNNGGGAPPAPSSTGGPPKGNTLDGSSIQSVGRRDAAPESQFDGEEEEIVARDEYELEARDAQLAELGEVFANLGKLARPASKIAKQGEGNGGGAPPAPSSTGGPPKPGQAVRVTNIQSVGRRDEASEANAHLAALVQGAV